MRMLKRPSPLALPHSREHGSTNSSRPQPSLRCRVRRGACPFKGILNSHSPRELPFAGFPPDKPYRLLLGLRQPEDDPWLDVDEDEEVVREQLRQRAVHIRDRREAVLRLLTGEPLAREAAWELLRQLMTELPIRHPGRYTVDGPTITNRLTGEAFDTSVPGVDPLEVAGRITQEDFCLMAPGPDSYRLVGGVVCFPSHWSLAEKLGMALPDIHDPVPRWRSDAAGPAQRFLSRLPPNRPFTRWNWSLSTTDELHLSRFYAPPPSPAAAPVDISGIAHLQLRLERQYFHRLPRTGYVVFTIRTYMQPLARAVRGRPAAAAALAAALRDLPYEHLQYKSNLQRRMPALLGFLDDVAAGDGGVRATSAGLRATPGTTAAAAAMYGRDRGACGTKAVVR